MQPKRVVSKARASAVFGGLLLLSCTGYVQPSEDGVLVAKPMPPAAAAPSGTKPNSATGSDLAASTAAPVTWAGSVGSWCGPIEEQTLWLSARPSAASCEVASRKLYTPATEDTAEGLTLQLDAASLGVLPAVLHVPARYCTASVVACSDVQVSLSVESYTPGQGIRGSWAFTPPGQAELHGQVDASWCNWDDFLPAHPEAERLARDIRIKEVSVYQGVKIPIVRDAQAVVTRNADLVQQRESLVRVFVEPSPGFQNRPIGVRITLQDEAEKPRRFEQIIDVSGPSTDENGASSFNLELPKDAFNPGTRYSVELRETSRCTALAGVPDGARFPEQGMAPVGARRTGPIKVMLVPVRYEADGSGRLPDTSPEQLLQMTKRLYSMYPTTEVMLSVRNVVATDRTELSDMLDQMRELRAADAPPSDLSYYGLVRQAETFGDYCQGTCTTGIAGFGSMNGTAAAGMGVGFPETAAGTFVHELGHIYRRPHAPCGGAGSPDESYPYPNAGLGSWGYDFQTRELFDPSTHVDFMSYCSPDWISDYNYQLILERIVVMNQRAFSRRIAADAPSSYRTLRVTKGGQARWGLELRAQLEPPGDPIQLKALDSHGAVVELNATFEDGPDGEQSYFVPAGHLEWQAIQIPGGPLVPYSGTTQNKPFSR